MGKGARVREVRAAHETLRVTHEPHEPVNWPEGHVRSEMTSSEHFECIMVEIHGVKHYLHTTTAAELVVSVRNTIDEWNKMAVGRGGKPVVHHKRDDFAVGTKVEGEVGVHE